MVLLTIRWTSVSPGSVPPPPSPPPGPSRCLARSQSPKQIHFICSKLQESRAGPRHAPG